MKKGYPGSIEPKEVSCHTPGTAGGGDGPYISGFDRQSEKASLNLIDNGPGGDNIPSTSKAATEWMGLNETVQIPFHVGAVGSSASASGIIASIPDASYQMSCETQGAEYTPRFSRKVFVGGLPPDIVASVLVDAFRRFGSLRVDWPHKTAMRSYFPPKGFAFLLFHDEKSVQQLINTCATEDGKLYFNISTPAIKDKPLQVRPWRLVDASYVLEQNREQRDPRLTVFVGGIPRQLKAHELAMIMGRMYGTVCFASIDTDEDHMYPKGAGRVWFTTQQSYIDAISARFIQIQYGDIVKRVEVKPYVLDNHMCDECNGQHTLGKYAPFFCANVTCLRYYCEQCWSIVHMRPGHEFHKPIGKSGPLRFPFMPTRKE